MSKVYQGKEVCQGCGKPGTEVSRYSKDELCKSCSETLKLGLAKDFEVKEEYTSVFSWPTSLPSLDFGDNTLSDLLRGLLEGLHNPHSNAIGNLSHPFNSPNIHGSVYHKIPTRVVEPMKEFFDKIQTIIREIEQEKILGADAEQAICEKFKGAYIKIVKDAGLFGKASEFIHIKEIRPEGMTDRFERIYEVEGSKVIFSKHFSTINQMRFGNLDDSFDAEELKSALVISKEEFEYAVYKVEAIKEIVAEMNK